MMRTGFGWVGVARRSVPLVVLAVAAVSGSETAAAADPAPFFDHPSVAWDHAFGDSPQKEADRSGTKTGRTTRGVPLGGMGGGNVMYNLAGTFGPWEFHTGRHEEVFPQAGAFSLWQRQGDRVRAVALATNTGGSSVMPAWPTLKVGEAQYHALYPRAWVDVGGGPGADVSMEQLSPFIPGDERDSSLPAATFTFRFANRTGKPSDQAVLFSFPNAWPDAGYARGGLASSTRSADGMRYLTLSAGHDNPAPTRDSSWTLATPEEPGVEVSATPSFNAGGDGAGLWKDFAGDGQLSGRPLDDSHSAGALAVRVHLDAHEVKQVRFALAWNFPVVELGPPSGPHSDWLRRYTEWFPAAGGSDPIALDALRRADDWRAAIARWQAPILGDDKLPDWLKQGALNELYYDTFGGIFWENGNLTKPKELAPDEHNFFEMESQTYALANSYDVRTYEAIHLGLLFPSIEHAVQAMEADEAVKNQPSQHAQHDNGFVDTDSNGLRSDTMFGPHYAGHPETDVWIDMDPRFALQVYQYVRLTGDTAIAKRMLPALRAGWAFDQSRDVDGDGIPDHFPGDYDPTFAFCGTGSLSGGLFVAALPAWQKLAELAGDRALADQVAKVASTAPQALDAKLWSPAGGYFRSDTCGPTSAAIQAEATTGDTIAEQNGLPSPYRDAGHLVSHLRQAYRLLVAHNAGGMVGAANQVNADGSSVPFNVGADEVWSGISYTLAAAMVWAGRHHNAPDLIADALATAKGTHDTSWHSDKNPYWFDVPEAWNRNDPTTFRADQYMRPRAIWELMLALDPQLEDRIKAVAAQGGHLAQQTTDTVAQAPPSRCVDGRTFTFRLHGRGGRVVRAVVYVNGRRVKTVKGTRLRRLTIGRLPRRTFRVRITTTTDHGVSTTSVRTYRGCTKTRPKTAVRRPHRRSSKRARPA